jgi:hypothetical protein
VFVEEVDGLFDSFNSIKHATPEKKSRGALSDDRPHVGHWAKAGMGTSSRIFLKDDKPAFNKPLPSQTGG